MEEKKIIYREIQKFKSIWLWSILIFIFFLVNGIFGYALISQISTGQPWGSKPVSTSVLIILSAFFFCFTLALIIIFAFAKLVTEVREDGLYIKYTPFIIKFRKISLENIKEVISLEYNPIGEYGGWGIRGRKNAKAYNTSGNHGVKISYNDNSHVLIGTQKKEELVNAIKSICKN